MGRAGAFEVLPTVFLFLAALVRVPDALDLGLAAELELLPATVLANALRVDFLAAVALFFTPLAAADFFFAELFTELFIEKAFLAAFREDIGEAFFFAAAFLLPPATPRLAPAADCAVRAAEAFEDVVFARRGMARSARRPPQRSNVAVRSADGDRPKWGQVRIGSSLKFYQISGPVATPRTLLGAADSRGKFRCPTMDTM